MSNTINVAFDGATSVQIDPLWQYDTEQTLVFTDLTLPETYQVDFGNHRDSGKAVPCVGTAEGVDIPDCVLSNGHTVFGWVYVDGMTTHRVIIPIRRRGKASDVEISSSDAETIATLISQMHSALDQMEEYTETVQGLVEQAESLVEQAQGLTATVDNEGYINIG